MKKINELKDGEVFTISADEYCTNKNIYTNLERFSIVKIYKKKVYISFWKIKIPLPIEKTYFDLKYNIFKRPQITFIGD